MCGVFSFGTPHLNSKDDSIPQTPSGGLKSFIRCAHPSLPIGTPQPPITNFRYTTLTWWHDRVMPDRDKTQCDNKISVRNIALYMYRTHLKLHPINYSPAHVSQRESRILGLTNTKGLAFKGKLKKKLPHLVAKKLWTLK